MDGQRRRGEAWPGKAGHGGAGLGKATPARRGMDWSGRARQRRSGAAPLGEDGKKGHGEASQGRHGWHVERARIG